MVTTLAWASDAHPRQGINVSHECYYLIRNACGVEWATVMTDRNNKPIFHAPPLRVVCQWEQLQTTSQLLLKSLSLSAERKMICQEIEE